MTTAYAVIGAQFGDEGKGTMTDMLSHQHGRSEAVVVRSNGGSQAGHTVVTPEGQRHVFSHFGSGSFTGARTHLSRFMIVNPIKFREERMKLLATGCRAPRISVDPNAMVTLPFDTLINQAVESFRGNNRHGSCGHGIGETVERNEHVNGFPITVGEVKGRSLDDLIRIRNEWVPMRLDKLGVTVIPEPYSDLLNSDNLLNAFINEFNFFDKMTEIVNDEDITDLGTVVFEGAQGLALDQTIGAFPYVTRSNTGLKNMTELARLANINHISAHYITRCYTTRHGAGPLNHEQDISDTILVNDPTNIPNDWQGSLRFAPLDVDFMRQNIKQDLLSVQTTAVRVDMSIVITCLDQIRDRAPVFCNGQLRNFRPEYITDAFATGFDCPFYVSYGPTRNDIGRVTNT